MAVTKAEYKETETDKGTDISYTYILECGSTKITLKSPTQRDELLRGAEFDIAFKSPQKSIADFEEEGTLEAEEQEILPTTLDSKTDGDSTSPVGFETPIGASPGTLITKDAFKDKTFGGLKQDVKVEKNSKENFLYAHALSVKTPGPRAKKSIENFCEALKEHTGLDWTHVKDNIFQAEQKQLNKTGKGGK